jgi:glycosyltransferase involved in cell wall biosynthesis
VVTLDKHVPDTTIDQSNGVIIHRLHRSGWPQVVDIHAGPSRRRLELALREIDPDIIHWHETWGLGGIPVSCPQVFTIHGFDSANVLTEGRRFGWARSRLWKLVEARGFPRYRHIISISPYVRRQIEPLTESAIHDIDILVDSRFFSLLRREEHGRVLCVGWITPRKNTLMSVKAFGAALRAGCRGRLIIAGSTNDRDYDAEVKKTILSLGLTEHVEFAGQLNREQLAKELSRATLLLLPSLQENSPAAVAEAMAAGLPVITSNRCGMPYMVEDGKSGFLVDPLVESQVAEALIRLLQDNGLCRQMGSRARAIAEARFHPSNVAARTVRVYETVLRESHSCPRSTPPKPKDSFFTAKLC